MVLYTNVSCPCSQFSTPRQLHFRPRAGPRPAPAGARECVFPTWVRTPAPARTRARAHARARSPNSVFAVKGEEEGVSVPPLSQTLSKENSIPTYQRYVGMLKKEGKLQIGMANGKWQIARQMANGECQLGRPMANSKWPMANRKASGQWQMANRVIKWQMANGKWEGIYINIYGKWQMRRQTANAK